MNTPARDVNTTSWCRERNRVPLSHMHGHRRYMSVAVGVQWLCGVGVGWGVYSIYVMYECMTLDRQSAYLRQPASHSQPS